MPFIEGVPTVTVQLDRERVLGFTMGAANRIKKLRGNLEVPTRANGKIDPEAMLDVFPVAVWACLDEADRAQLSPAQIEDMLHPGNMPAIMDALFQLGVFGRAADTEASADAGPTEPAGPKLAATA